MNKFLTKEEIISLHNRFLAGDKEAGGQIILSYRYYLRKQANYLLRLFQLPNWHFEDLLAELQLMALEKLAGFDPQKGSLPTYLGWHLRNTALEFALLEMKGVRLPASAGKELAALRTALKEDQSGSMTVEQLSQVTGLQPARIEVLLPYCFGRVVCGSAYLRVSGDDESTDFLDSVAADDLSAEEQLYRQEKQQHYQSALSRLSLRERQIITGRYPSSNEAPMQLDDLATSHGISRQRVHQIEQAVIEKLKKIAAT